LKHFIIALLLLVIVTVYDTSSEQAGTKRDVLIAKGLPSAGFCLLANLKSKAKGKKGRFILQTDSNEIMISRR